MHNSRQSIPISYNGEPFPSKLPLPMGDLDPHLIHDSLGPSAPKTQTASRLFQPFLHSSLQSVPVLYNWLPHPPSKLPVLMGWGIWAPSNAWFLGPTQVLKPNDISIDSAVFAWLTTVTKRPTDHTTRSVTIGNIYVGNVHTLCPNKNDTTLSCYNSEIHELIWTTFGTNVTEKVGNQNVLYFHLT